MRAPAAQVRGRAQHSGVSGGGRTAHARPRRQHPAMPSGGGSPCTGASPEPSTTSHLRRALVGQGAGQRWGRGRGCSEGGFLFPGASRAGVMLCRGDTSPLEAIRRGLEVAVGESSCCGRPAVGRQRQRRGTRARQQRAAVDGGGSWPLRLRLLLLLRPDRHGRRGIARSRAAGSSGRCRHTRLGGPCARIMQNRRANVRPAAAAGGGRRRQAAAACTAGRPLRQDGQIVRSVCGPSGCCSACLQLPAGCEHSLEKQFIPPGVAATVERCPRH